MTYLSCEVAHKAINKAFELSRTDYDGRPMTVAVCDKEGFLLAFARMDNVKLMTVELTQRKAYTAARMGQPTHAFLERLHNEKLEASYFDPKFSPLPGGVPVFDREKRLLGAVAVGGISVREDQEAAEKLAAFLGA